MDVTAKWVGYSNGVAYPLYSIKDHNVGLCQLQGYSNMVWCTFESIEQNKEYQKETIKKETST